MSLFDQLVGTIRGVIEGYDLQPSRQLAHIQDCLCHRCVFVRGIRGELAAFAKAEKRAGKRVDVDWVSGLVAERWVSWTGCRAQIACLHYRDDDDEPRPTALCKPCGKASEKKRAK